MILLTGENGDVIHHLLKFPTLSLLKDPVFDADGTESLPDRFDSMSLLNTFRVIPITFCIDQRM
ncbi:hypothetical protein JWG39_14635 [Desulforhopalus vacuolatus]|uniref:hypothetical protein n=1 Tax=Desulforhopalus vacuolatus TaxID=40414 RepID=UPI0019635571|nr:hypothetical protein [Desulforhopalus vacuolatus]MBM9521055.1 hypothetical protein [Desulforhopalus vacuolatus]